jgi:hypothetical protein
MRGDYGGKIVLFTLHKAVQQSQQKAAVIVVAVVTTVARQAL